MKKKKPSILLLVLIVSVFIPFSSFAQGVIKAESGARIVSESGSYWVVDNGSFTLTSPSATYPATMANLNIKATASLTIPPLNYLTVTGTLTNIAGNSGLIMNSDATGTSSLISGTNGVNGTVNQTIEKNGQWHFLSCPVCPFNQSAMPEICDGNFAPVTVNFDATTGATYDLFFWQEPFATGNLNWINLKKTDWSVNTTDFGNPPRFVSGKGYLVEYSSAFGGSSEKTFSGSLGTGSINSPVTKTSGGNFYNLIGNPYPSYIDWKAPSGWTRTVLEDEGGGKNVWIWNGASGNYGVYNTASAGDIGTNGVSRLIAPEQGFFVKAATGGDVSMTDAVRCHGAQAWLKTDDNSLKLKVTSLLNEYSDEVKLEFDHQITGGGEKWFSIYDQAPSFYMPVGDQIYSLRFLGAVSENRIIPLSFKGGKDGNYTITANGTEAFTNVILQDLKTGVFQDLKTNPAYSFFSTTSDDANRFLIRFGPVGIDPVEKGNNGIYTYNNILCINNPGESTVEVFNMIGQKMVTERTHNDLLYKIKLDEATGYYVVRLTSGQKVITEKIFVK